jgi:hypothetical protein
VLNYFVVGVVLSIGAGLAFWWLRPPTLTPLSDEWLDHTNYQLSKDGTSLHEQANGHLL